MKVLTVVGARPQFIKAAVVSRALAEAGVHETLVHTGQHYDAKMSDVFFRELGMREPAFNLGIGSGAHGEQTGRMLSDLERVMREVAADRVLVYGDTNSTLAGALAAAKLAVPVDHVEAGLRSFDRDMPEELNRVLTDRLSDQLFCPTRTAVANLHCEGLTDGVAFTGDVMLDLALQVRDAARATALPHGLHESQYFIATIHRASNTDDAEQLHRVMRALVDVARLVAPVALPVHPRLARALEANGVQSDPIHIIEPVGYLEMQGLILRSRGVITDSGGVQKEALFHGKRCLTLRTSTEWVESVEAGLNVLLGDDLTRVVDYAAECNGEPRSQSAILSMFGDGQASRSIADAVLARGSARRRWSERAPR
jgi:UDP-N-acetylglucosamine 2-epimerase